MNETYRTINILLKEIRNLTTEKRNEEAAELARELARQAATLETLLSKENN